jgi:hypothetical protein
MAADFEAAIESGSQALTGNHLVPVNLSKRQAFIAFICVYLRLSVFQRAVLDR